MALDSGFQQVFVGIGNGAFGQIVVRRLGYGVEQNDIIPPTFAVHFAKYDGHLGGTGYFFGAWKEARFSV